MPLQAELTEFAPLSRENLQERVYRALRHALMRGAFPPGRSLTIRALAAALKTSAMPVREALRQLVAERALTMLPNRSFGTPLMTVAQFDDLRRIRMRIEGLAAAEAATRIDRTTLQHLEEIDTAMATAARRVKRERFIELNQEFHFTIYEAAGSAVLMPIIESLWLQIGPYLTFVFPDGERPQVTHATHRPVIVALKRRDAAAAEAALAADIDKAGEVLKRIATFATQDG